MREKKMRMLDRLKHFLRLAAIWLLLQSAWAQPIMVLQNPPTTSRIEFDGIPSQRITSGSNITITPNSTGGTVTGWAATGLPSECTCDSETGEITGSSLAAQAKMVVLTASNSGNGDAYTQYVPINVTSSSVTLDQTYLDGLGGPPYTLSTSNCLYTLAVDVTANGTAFNLTGTGIVFDLGGYDVTYDNATPINIDNPSFETVDGVDPTLADGWDFTNAANCTRVASSVADKNAWDGSYCLEFADSTATEYVTNDTTITLEANTTYSLSMECFYGTTNPGVQIYAEIDDGTDTYTVSTTGAQSLGTTLKNQQFTTGATPGNFTLTVGIVGHVSGANPVYIDRLKIRRSRCYGIVCGAQDYDTTMYPDISSFSNASHACVVRNGSITQGQDEGWRSHAFHYRSSTASSYATIENVTISVNGDDSSCTHTQSGTRYCNVNNCDFYSTVEQISARSAFDGCITQNYQGSYFDNVIHSGPQSGVVPLNNVASTIRDNVFTLNANVTNSFMINAYDALEGNRFHNNTLTAGTGANTCRGIFNMSVGWGNTITAQTLSTNLEYGGVYLGGVYCNQIEYDPYDHEIFDETYTVTGDYGGHCLRLNFKDSPTPTGVVDVHDCDFIVDVSDNLTSGTGGKQPSCLYFSHFDGASFLNLYDCNLTSNCSLFVYDGDTAGDDTNFTLEHCTITYVDDGISYDLPWVVSYDTDFDLTATILNCPYGDAGSKAWLRQNMHDANARDSNFSQANYSITVVNDITLTISDGSPLASTAVTVTDAQSNVIFSGSTNGSGQISFQAKDWTLIDNTDTEYNPCTVSVSGYQDGTIDLDVDDYITPPTIVLVPE